MNQATTKSIFLPFVFCFAGMSNPPYGGVEPPFLKGDLAGFLDEVMRDTIKCKDLPHFAFWQCSCPIYGVIVPDESGNR